MGLTPRGPDGTRSVQVHDHVILGFTRLAINGLSEAGMQPFGYGKGGVVNENTFVICNGEIRERQEKTMRVYEGVCVCGWNSNSYNLR